MRTLQVTVECTNLMQRCEVRPTEGDRAARDARHAQCRSRAALRDHVAPRDLDATQSTLPPNSTICVGSWALCSAVSVRAIAKVILELVEACPNGPSAKPGSEPCEEDREMR